MRQDVGQRAHQHAEVAIKCAHFADRLGTVVIESPRLAGALQPGHRQEWLEMLFHGDRTASGTAAAVGRGERLVQVEVHHVHAEIAGTRDTHQRVHVGAIHIQQRAFRVQDFRRLDDARFEDTQRVGIGDHQPGHVFSPPIFRAPRDRAARASFGADIFHRIAGDGRRSGIGAMRRIGNQDFLARIAALFE